MPNFSLSHKRVKVAGRMTRPLPAAWAVTASCGFCQRRRDPAQGPPDSLTNLHAGKRAKMLERGVVAGAMGDEAIHRMDDVGRAGSRCRSRKCASSGAISGRRVAIRRRVRLRGSLCGDAAEAPPRYGVRAMPCCRREEVYAVLRENGFSPLGIPHQRGFVYMIAVIDRAGNDGQLVIDARDGRIIRFMPAYRMGEIERGFQGPMARTGRCRRSARCGVRRGRRPPSRMSQAAPPPCRCRNRRRRASIEVKPLAAKPAPEPPQQSAAVDAKPADARPRRKPPRPRRPRPSQPRRRSRRRRRCRRCRGWSRGLLPSRPGSSRA